MMRTTVFLMTAAAVTALATTAGAQDRTLNFQIGTSDRGGVCGVELPTADGPKLEISVRSDNGNVNIALIDVPGDLVNAGLEAGTTPQMTLAFDGGPAVTTELGAWRAGFNYRILGAWRSPQAGHSALRALKTARSVTVTVDGQSWGPIPTQEPGMAWTMLEGCVTRNGGAMPS